MVTEIKERRRAAIERGYVPDACVGCDASNFTSFGSSPGCLMHCSHCRRATGALTALLLDYKCVPCFVKVSVMWRIEYKVVRPVARFVAWRIWGGLRAASCVMTGGHVNKYPAFDRPSFQNVNGPWFRFAICSRCDQGYTRWIGGRP